MSVLRSVIGSLDARVVDDVLYAVIQDLKHEAEAEDNAVRAPHPECTLRLDVRRAICSHAAFSRSFPKPFERIESLHLALHFRVPLGNKGMGNLEIMSAR